MAMMIISDGHFCKISCDLTKKECWGFLSKLSRNMIEISSIRCIFEKNAIRRQMGTIAIQVYFAWFALTFSGIKLRIKNDLDSAIT